MTDQWKDPQVKRATDALQGERDADNGPSAAEKATQREFDRALEKIDRVEAAGHEADLEHLDQLWGGRIPQLGAHARSNGGERANPHEHGTAEWRAWDMREMGVS
jgi:hypothetical protein